MMFTNTRSISICVDPNAQQFLICFLRCRYVCTVCTIVLVPMDSFHFAAFIVWKPPLFPCEQSRMSNTDNMQRQLKITDKIRKVMVQLRMCGMTQNDVHCSPSGPVKLVIFLCK